MHIAAFPFHIRMRIDDAMHDLVEGSVEIKDTDMQNTVRIRKAPNGCKSDCLITFVRPSGIEYEVELNDEFTVHYEDTVNFVSIADFTESKRLV